MSEAHVTEYLPAYALGALDEADLLAVARHLPGCPACREELAGWYRAAESLSAAVPLRQPPDDLRARIVERAVSASRGAVASAAPTRARNIGRAAGPSRSASSNRAAPAHRPGPSLPGWLTSRSLLAAGVLALVLLMAASNLFLLQQINGIRARAGDSVRMITLNSTEAAPQASGYMLAFPGERDGSLTVDELPPLNADRQYQVWLIKDGMRESGGVFSVNEAGYGVLHITAPQPLDSYDGFGITIEPAGGSPGPTGEKVLGYTASGSQ